MAKKEDEYKAQLVAAGIWQDGFAPAVHDLCVLERRKSAAMKDWDETAPRDEKGKKLKRPSILDPLHDKILELEQEIYKQREGLGLTAKGLHRLKPPEEKASGELTVVLQLVGGDEAWMQ